MNNDQNDGIKVSDEKVIRHCMVVHAYYPLGETRVEREALALLDAGIEVDVICLRDVSESDDAEIDGIRVHRLPVKRNENASRFEQFLEYMSFFILAFIKLTMLHSSKNFDVVQVHNLPDFLVFVAMVPKLLGASVILDIHDLMPEFYAERFNKPMQSLSVRLIQWQERFSCRYADHVITVTELWRQTLIARGQAAAKVSVVMNVADERFFHRGISKDLPENHHIHLIYHGVVGHRHGLDIALSAMEQVVESGIPVQLTIHGGGEAMGFIENLASELGVQENITISKVSVPTPELVEMIRKADVGIIPYRDGIFSGGILPTKLMEYAALGMPAIVSRTPSICDYFDETMVEFFDPGDADGFADCIRNLHHNRDRLAELGANIVEFNDRFNWSIQSADYVKLVRGLSADRV